MWVLPVIARPCLGRVAPIKTRMSAMPLFYVQLSRLHVVQLAGVLLFPGVAAASILRRIYFSIQRCTRPRNSSLFDYSLLSLHLVCPGDGFSTLGLGFPLGVCPSPGSAVARLAPISWGSYWRRLLGAVCNPRGIMASMGRLPLPRRFQGVYSRARSRSGVHCMLRLHHRPSGAWRGPLHRWVRVG